jgi:CheY-like chemotaxis protein
MKAEKTKVLVVTDVLADATQIGKLLEDQFEQVMLSTNEASFVADFERFEPDVVVLAFNSLERAERYALGLYRHSTVVHTLPHRSIVLCSKETVHRAFELCRKEYFDDYVMYWPLVYDTPRLAMSIILAARSLEAQRHSTPVRAVAAHARSVSALEAVLDKSIETGRQRSEALRQAIHDVGQTPLLDPGIAAGNAAAPEASEAPLTFDIDTEGVPEGAVDRTRLFQAAAKQIRDTVKLRVDEAERRITPLTEWIGGIKQAVKPQLDAARQLGALNDMTMPLVLVVDDDTFQCRLLERMLGSEKYRTVFAHTGAEALAIVGRQHPDVVLMDVALPDFNGVEITRHMKASPHLADIPIVMITGHSERQVLEASLKAGAIDFLVKPFDREALFGKLARHIAR